MGAAGAALLRAAAADLLLLGRPWAPRLCLGLGRRACPALPAALLLGRPSAPLSLLCRPAADLPSYEEEEEEADRLLLHLGSSPCCYCEAAAASPGPALDPALVRGRPSSGAAGASPPPFPDQDLCRPCRVLPSAAADLGHGRGPPCLDPLGRASCPLGHVLADRLLRGPSGRLSWAGPCRREEDRRTSAFRYSYCGPTALAGSGSGTSKIDVPAAFARYVPKVKTRCGGQDESPVPLWKEWLAGRDWY